MFKHGDKVIIFDAYGHHKTGSLHLPDMGYSVFNHATPPIVRREKRPQYTDGAYGVHTLILSGGRRYRTEGRLYAA